MALPTVRSIAETLTKARLAAAAPDDFAALWPHVRDEADARVHEAERKLAERADTEPAAIADLYRIALRRLEPVGLVYLWPAVRG